MFALAFSRLFCSAFSKAEAQRLERKNGVSLLAFVFGFAKQMTDVSQARKEAPMPSKKAAKEFWWLRIVPQTIASAYLLSLFSLQV